MTAAEFIRNLKTQTSDSAVLGTVANLQRPPGRKPRTRDVELSQWYERLAGPDRTFVNSALRESAELAVFSFLCVLDGVSTIENGPEKGELRLSYVKDGVEILLNDPSQELLHDSYNSLCQASDVVSPNRPEERVYEVDSAINLREAQTASDGLDLHSVSPKTGDRSDLGSPSIALPKNEHRKL